MRLTERMGTAQAGDLKRYHVVPGSISWVQVDADTVCLSIGGVYNGQSCVLTVEDLVDVANRRLLNDRPPAVLNSQKLSLRH